jgi:TRAP-type C4-dicarboxylate transport system substrate-binding protein
MKKINIYISVIIIIIVSLMLTVCTPAPDSGKPIEISFAYAMPAQTSTGMSYEWFGEELGKRSQGQIKVTTYPASSLFKIPDAFDSVVKGIGDITIISPRLDIQRLPLTAVQLLPTIAFPPGVKGLNAASEAYMNLNNSFSEIEAEFKDVKLLWFQALPEYLMLSTKPVRTPADVKGMKIGAGGSMGDFMKEAGATPVSLPPKDIYMSLKTGVIDAVLGSWTQVDGEKWHEVTNSYTNYGFGRVSLIVIMNKDKWNMLSRSQQKMVNEIAIESRAYGFDLQQEQAARAQETVTGAGKSIIELTPEERAQWDEAGRPLEAKWIADKKADGYANADKIVKKLKELAAKSWK